MVDELKNRKPDENEIVDQGFCKWCGCPDSSVEQTKTVTFRRWKTINGKRTLVASIRKIRYRKCDHCRRRFTTQEVTM